MIRLLSLLVLLTAFVLSNTTYAATRVLVRNNTNLPVEIIKLSVDSDPLSKKTWKKEATRIASASEAAALSINRTGKFNWMDPTPRFIEPGKTAFFTIQLRIGDTDSSLVFRQKLLGTGSGSRLWYRVESSDDKDQWTLPYQEISGSLIQGVGYVYRAVKTDKDDNLEIVISEEK